MSIAGFKKQLNKANQVNFGLFIVCSDYKIRPFNLESVSHSVSLSVTVSQCQCRPSVYCQCKYIQLSITSSSSITVHDFQFQPPVQASSKYKMNRLSPGLSLRVRPHPRPRPTKGTSSYPFRNLPVPLTLPKGKVTLKVINQDRMFFADFSVNCQSIFMTFCRPNNHISTES